MIALPDLATVAGIVAAIAVAATAAGLGVVRLLAGRSVATLMSVVAAVTIVTSLAGVAVIALAMLIVAHDRTVVLTVVAIAGVAGFTVAILVGRQVTMANRLLLGAVRRVGTDGRYQPPAVTLPAEFAAVSAELAAAHEHLARVRARERTLDASRRELVAWVSHDLRAPLAGLRAMAEALEDQVVTDPAAVGSYHAQIRRETDRLSAMIDDLFELSRVHAGALRLHRRPLRLGDLVDDVLASAEPLARAKRVSLGGSADTGPPVTADAAELGRALRNLVINAIRHTPPEHPVEVHGTIRQGMACVSVSDSCGGIPDDELPQLLDPEAREQRVRTRGPRAGTGLGLSIARGIVEAHAGEIDVQNTGAGCRFTIQLPLGHTAAEVGARPG